MFTVIFDFSIVYNRQQPDSRGSTPTLDNGKYDSTSAIPTVGSAMYSIPRGEGVYSSESHPQGLPALPAPSRQRCKDYDGKNFTFGYLTVTSKADLIISKVNSGFGIKMKKSTKQLWSFFFLFIKEKGFCMRGDLCPYDHGLDPVIVEDVSIPPPPYVPGMLPF